MSRSPSVCLVTEELAGLEGSGGIGAAFYELSCLLLKHNFAISILYCPVRKLEPLEIKAIVSRFKAEKIELSILDERKYFYGPSSPELKSYAIYQAIKNSDYDFIHFHDFKGLGFSSISAKCQGISFESTQLVMQMHGPHAWLQEVNETLPTSNQQLKYDFMERESARKADHVVSPSQYLLDFLGKKGFRFPGNTTHVLKNVVSFDGFTGSDTLCHAGSENLRADELVFFARHEGRKGIKAFCDAITLINDYLTLNNIKVTFLGGLGTIDGMPSLVYLANKGIGWSFQLSIISDFNRNEAMAYLASNARSMVVIPSEENSPYSVLESIGLNKKIITSLRGGAKELIKEASHEAALCDSSNASALKESIVVALSQPFTPTQSAYNKCQVDEDWLFFHSQHLSGKKNPSVVEDIASGSSQRVTVGITHYERPEKLIDAICSIVNQTYKNIEIIICDDGSSSDYALSALEKINRYINEIGATLIRQENRYLGAARNAIIQRATGHYICFLDDDDLAKTTMIDSLVIAAEKTNAEVISCPSEFMDITLRAQGVANPDFFNKPVSYVPLGGPLSVALVDNVLSTATALIRMDCIDKIGGYSELRDTGFEDYEIYFKIVQAGGRIEVFPEALFLYETGVPSMVTTTASFKNFRRLLGAIDSKSLSENFMDSFSLLMGGHAQKVQEQLNSLFHDTKKDLVADVILSESHAGILETSLRYASAIKSNQVTKALQKVLGLRDKEGLSIEDINSEAVSNDIQRYDFYYQSARLCSLLSI